MACPRRSPPRPARGLDWLDATCPLVSKVHRQAERQIEAGRHIIFIGHKGHPEVIGTLGQVPDGAITLVESVEDVNALPSAPRMRWAS
jgi:4-hydroxy-3-methylbut-2-enyl diphosphate reductase